MRTSLAFLAAFIIVLTALLGGSTAAVSRPAPSAPALADSADRPSSAPASASFAAAVVGGTSKSDDLSQLAFAAQPGRDGIDAGATQPAAQITQTPAERCFDFHRFGAEPVDVAKTADGETVLAQVMWGYHDSIGCYLVLDDGAIVVLREASIPRNLPNEATDVSRECFGHHRFGENPVDVAKTADNQIVLARLTWGWHDSIGCYLVLDDEALTTLRADAEPQPDLEPVEGGTPFTAEELGCVGPDAPCEIRNGQVYATRIMSHAELLSSGGFGNEELVNRYVPDVPEAEALAVLSECLQSWDEYVPSWSKGLEFTGSPAMGCNAVWRSTSYAVNHLGVSDYECVFDAYEHLWLRSGRPQSRGAFGGWAGPPALPAPQTGEYEPSWNQDVTEFCESWLDPVPDRNGLQECARLRVDRSYILEAEGTSRDPDWERWGLTEYLYDADGELTDEWWKPTYCTWMAKCTDLVKQITDHRDSGFNSCDLKFAPLLINIARRGRCGGWRLLAQIALLWARGEPLPNVTKTPGDQLIAC